jgi:hypothetical protein
MARFEEQRQGLIRLLIDLAVPLGSYYLLRACHVSDATALLGGAGTATVLALALAIASRKVRRETILVAALFLLLAALGLLTHDPRLVLVKPSIITAGLAVYFLASIARRPALFEVCERMATRGDPALRVRWNEQWQQSAALRARVRLATALMAASFLAEAAGRAWLAMREPISRGVLLVHVPLIIMMVLLVLIGRFLLRPAARRAMQAQ